MKQNSFVLIPGAGALLLQHKANNKKERVGAIKAALSFIRNPIHRPSQPAAGVCSR
jgi:hypothetical protein